MNHRNPIGILVHQVVGELWPITLLSLRVSGAALLISSLIGIPLGTWVGLGDRRVRSIVTVLARTGMALPPVVVGLLLYLLLSRSGPLGELEWLFTPKAMVLAQIILTFPFVLGITMDSVAAVPNELALQVRSLGAGPRQVRWAVLREARSGVLLALAIGFGRSVSEVGAVLIVGGNIRGQTRVLTTAIVLETGKGDFGLALALGGILLTLALAVNVLVVRLRGRAGS